MMTGFFCFSSPPFEGVRELKKLAQTQRTILPRISSFKNLIPRAGYAKGFNQNSMNNTTEETKVEQKCHYCGETDEDLLHPLDNGTNNCDSCIGTL